MLATTSSRVRMRALTGLGRRLPAASRRRAGTDGAAVGAATPPRPSADMTRPGVGDDMEASI